MTMTSPEPMTREELLEHAALDAFGLLDEYETALYSRSFHHAPVAVQDEILHLQSDLVSDESLLAAENPDAGLRQRVLDAVAHAIERETSQLAPLATIGRTRLEREQERPEIAGRIGGGAGMYWRAACFALCGALIVMTYALTEAKTFNQEVTIRALSNLTDEQLEKLIGPTVKDFLFDRASTRVVLGSMNSIENRRGALFVTEAGKAFLVVEGLPMTKAGEAAYTLNVKDSLGNEQAVKEFAVTDRILGARFDFDAAIAANIKNVNWLVRDAAGNVLLASI
jgi:hypothetical protein